jgi:hypothetical protein
MIAVPKLLVIVLLAVAAWYAMRWWNRPPAPVDRRRESAPPRPRPAAIEAEDLVACRVCGSYVATSAHSCGKANCPQPALTR